MNNPSLAVANCRVPTAKFTEWGNRGPIVISHAAHTPHMPTTYTVGPYKQKLWKVEADGRRVSTHRSKQNAIQKARDLRDRNDDITIKGRNGRFQKRL